MKWMFFRMSSKFQLAKEERCFVVFVLMEERFFFLKMNVISMRRHGPHSESQWAPLCSALLHSTHVTCYHVLPAFNHLQGPSLFSLPKFGTVILPRAGLFLVPFPGRDRFSFLRTFYTVPWAQPACFSVGNGDIFPVCKAEDVKVNTHLHLVLSVRTNAAIPPLPFSPIWRLGMVLGVR
jgi:hypothetical protein